MALQLETVGGVDESAVEPEKGMRKDKQTKDELKKSRRFENPRRECGRKRRRKVSGTTNATATSVRNEMTA